MRSKMLTWPDVATTATVFALVQGGKRLGPARPLALRGLLQAFPGLQRRKVRIPIGCRFAATHKTRPHGELARLRARTVDEAML